MKNAIAFYSTKSDDYISEDDVGVDGDILILHQSDIERLKQQIQLLKHSDKAIEDKCFIAMVEWIIDFMIEHSEQNSFIFEGEF